MVLNKVFRKFPFIAQHDAMDCGPACLAMISSYYGKDYGLQYMRDCSYLTREGVSLVGLTEAAVTIGMKSVSLRITAKDLVTAELYPVVLFWNACHFVVLYAITKAKRSQKYIFHIADPEVGRISVPEDEFMLSWGDQEGKGIVFAPQPTEEFYTKEVGKTSSSPVFFLKKYVTVYGKELAKIGVCLASVSALSLTLPYLAQILIDKGITNKNYGVLNMILFAQLSIYLGTVLIEVIRNWVVLYTGTRINIDIITDFFVKIMKLPLRFFDTKFLGDFYQRVQDHQRIKDFLTSQSMTTIFSIVSFMVFFIALFNYSGTLLTVYLLFTLGSIVWAQFFFHKREMLDYFRFKNSSMNQQAISELIYGIRDIKVNNFEKYKINQWREIQKKNYFNNLKSLKLDQCQLMGFECINQVKNLLVTYIAARAVIQGNMTFGGMMSVSYIIGQMNSPITQLINFSRGFQDAKLSISRLAEVQNLKEEDEGTTLSLPNKLSEGIQLHHVGFQYEGSLSPFVLHDINLKIPLGKMTAIVGASGSGKTTLMKLLLKFYQPSEGLITVNGMPLNEIISSNWHDKCGVVMQDGYLFSDTFARNISTNKKIEQDRLEEAMKVANIKNFVDTLPQREYTMGGSMGNGMSGGQMQRLLIARAIYKQPEFIFFDEATSALDAENENVIQHQLRKFLRNRTSIVIAHRLSTIKNADQIVVLYHGHIMEIGNHNSLIKKQGYYYNLIQNQL